jgi:hypothetical protein
VINFLAFVASFIAGILVIMTAPNIYIKEYLSIYTMSSLSFSILSFVYFSYFASVRRSKYILLWSIVIFFIVEYGIGINLALIVFYPAALIFGDLFATQSRSAREVNLYRLIMLSTVIPFFIAPSLFFINIFVRCLFLWILSLYFMSISIDMHRITVKSPVRLLVGNYMFYNGILVAIPYINIDGNQLRFWFISVQGGLVLILKYFDYSLRKSYNEDVNLKYLVFLLAFFAPLPVFILYPNIMVLAAFYVGYFGLIYTGRYIHS